MIYNYFATQTSERGQNTLDYMPAINQAANPWTGAMS
jgi:hypothetical protein